MQLDKVTSQPFSFFNFSKKKTPYVKKNLLALLYFFLILQFFFFNFNFINIIQYTEKVEIEGTQTFDNYAKLQEALVKGEQDNIIYEFIQLKSKDLAIADLLVAGVMKVKNTQNIANKYSYKIDKNTNKTLDMLFEKMSDSGYQKEKMSRNKFFSCNMVDFSCIALSYFVRDSLEKSLENVRLKSQIVAYDSQHPKEYKEFINKIEKNPPNIEFIKSPGTLHFENKNK